MKRICISLLAPVALLLLLLPFISNSCLYSEILDDHVESCREPMGGPYIIEQQVSFPWPIRR